MKANADTDLPSLTFLYPQTTRGAPPCHGVRSPSTLTRRSAGFGARKVAARRELQQWRTSPSAAGVCKFPVHRARGCSLYETSQGRRELGRRKTKVDEGITAGGGVSSGCDLHHTRRRVTGRHQEDAFLDAHMPSMLHNEAWHGCSMITPKAGGTVRFRSTCIVARASRSSATAGIGTRPCVVKDRRTTLHRRSVCGRSYGRTVLRTVVPPS